MAKKRKSKKKITAFIRGTASGLGWFLIRILPLALIVALSYGVFIGIKNYLYADQNLMLKMSVLPLTVPTQKSRS